MLSVAIETSYGMHAVAVCADGEVIFSREVRWDDGEFRDLGHLTESGLSAAGAGVQDVGRIGVDCGPGNRSSVRTGVAYANGLAFGLGIEVVAVSSLEIMASEAGYPAGSEPFLSLRVSGGQVFGGLLRDEEPPRFCRGRLAAVLGRLTQGLQRVTVAGDHRDEVAAQLPGALVKDSGVVRPAVTQLGGLIEVLPGSSPVSGPGAVPLTDTSPVFLAAEDERSTAG